MIGKKIRVRVLGIICKSYGFLKVEGVVLSIMKLGGCFKTLMNFCKFCEN